MEKCPARRNRRCQRLLIGIFLTVIPHLYSEIHIPLTETIEITVKNDVLFITDELQIEAAIYHPSGKNDREAFTPFRFVLEETGEYTEIVKSTRTADEERTILNAAYRLKQTGSLTFSSAFIETGKKKVMLPPFSITVREAPLSERTAFNWRVCSLNGKTYLNDTEPLIQGETYILFVTAAFFSSEEPAVFLQRLPAVLHTIECPAPENAAVEPFIPPPSFVYPQTGNPPYNSDNAADSLEKEPQSGKRHHILAAFTWTPFYHGRQRLPEAKIRFASGETVLTGPAVRMVYPQKAAAPAENSSLHPAFSQPAPVEPQDSTGKDTAAMTAAARKIAQYRHKELYTILSSSIRAERKKLEAELGLSEVLPLYPLLFWKITAVAAFVFSLLFVFFLHRKKTLYSVLFFAVAAGCGIIAFTLYRDARFSKGICLINGSTAAVRHIPEQTGSSVFQLAIGEEVHIVTEIPLWYFIKTQNGTYGWIPKTAVAVYTELQE